MKKSDKDKFSKQRVRDPVHDLIIFEDNEFENELWKIVQSEPFQRLRRIKQLGFSDFVFPGATHSRFVHSLGVFHIAKQLIKIIRREQGDNNYERSKANSAISASLLHDLGHGPFSHAFEKACSDLDGAPKNHEEVTKRIIREHYSSNFTACGCNADDVIGNIDKPETIYGSVVSSQFDADRLDYMQRDCLMTGSEHPGIDCQWLMDNLKIGKHKLGSDRDESDKERETLVIGPKARYAAETYIMSLFQLYPTIYFHKTTRGIEVLFRAMLKEIINIAKQGDVKQKKLCLSPTHPLLKFIKEPGKLDNYLALDDTVIWSSLPLLRNSKNNFIKEIAERLLTRKLYKAYDVRRKFFDTAIEKWPRQNKLLEELESQQQRDNFITKAEAILKEKMHGTSGMGTKILLDDGYRDLYKQNSNELIYISSYTDIQSHVDIGVLSSIINPSYKYEFFRIYTPDECCEETKTVERLINESINESIKYQKGA